MGEKRYNGWKNYETWAVALWIGNDQGSYGRAMEMVDNAWDCADPDKYFSRSERARLDLADSLKDWFEEENPLSHEASVFSDFLSAALSEVDWLEIADNFLSDRELSASEDDEKYEPAK